MDRDKPKTFSEIEARLKSDLKKITQEILDIENFIALGQDMLEKQMQSDFESEAVFKYKNDLVELQSGLKTFQAIKAEIEQTLEKLYNSVKRGDEYIK